MMLKRNLGFFLLYHESPVFLGKGNDLREEFQCTKNTTRMMKVG